ncbi:hemerythrin [Legionella antarctica]|uniref:Hemerythrin n=1 Tax=Legionella antarctica TaxID=2708020 RepID=A0A6F8T711_9GAMM|nr:hemerythrin domain-containing protein [Legionella antarctica]BCA96003.1 hemerythrin [Legionella antarctica]
MNAIDFLIKEHNDVRHALAKIEENSLHDETKRQMFQSLCQDLIRHETMEHVVWYPHFKNDQRLNPTVRHLLSEEKTAEEIIKQFEHIDAQQEWDRKFSKLKNEVEHHADEEEEKLFPEVKKILTEDDLEKIGLDMFHFKKDYPN